MFEHFTKTARRLVLAGVTIAADQGADKAGPGHLLLALAQADDGVGARVLAGYGITAANLRPDRGGDSSRRAGLTDDEVAALRSVGIDADEVLRRIEEALGPEAAEPSAPAPSRWRGRVGGPLDPQAKKVLELSLREALALGHRSIGSEHVLLALLRQGVQGSMGAVLAGHGVTYDDAKRRILAECGKAA